MAEPPAIAPVAGATDPAAVPPPSKLAADPNISVGAVATVEQEDDTVVEELRSCPSQAQPADLPRRMRARWGAERNARREDRCPWARAGR